jgi:hypothetical protein
MKEEILNEVVILWVKHQKATPCPDILRKYGKENVKNGFSF